MAKRLTGAGFVRVDLVDSPGQFALRGGIVDIYSPFGTFADSDGDTKSGAYALRIELFGDGMDEREMALRSGVMAALCTIHTCRLLEKERA